MDYHDIYPVQNGGHHRHWTKARACVPSVRSRCNRWSMRRHPLLELGRWRLTSTPALATEESHLHKVWVCYNNVSSWCAHVEVASR
jgi:hypothetical protein